jgi:YfiH family protein
MKEKRPDSSLIRLRRFERLPFLEHGFGDSSWRVRDLRRLAEKLGLRPVLLKQVHSDVVHFLDEPPQRTLRGDAAVTRLPGLLLAIRTADCLPVLLVEEKRRVIGAVHCGWKGTSRRILEKAVREMQRCCGADPGSMLAALGPCIGPACYEVKGDVRQVFAAAGFPDSVFHAVKSRPGRFLLDLRSANRLELLKLGVKARNIFSLNLCTHCQPHYPSYRRDKEKCGRMVSFIGLTPI